MLQRDHKMANNIALFLRFISSLWMHLDDFGLVAQEHVQCIIFM